jgi:hypothetical protein
MLQTILFPRKFFTLPEAILWLTTHNYRHSKVDITTNFLRFRQHEPTSHGNYYTVTLKNGVEMVYEKSLV